MLCFCGDLHAHVRIMTCSDKVCCTPPPPAALQVMQLHRGRHAVLLAPRNINHIYNALQGMRDNYIQPCTHLWCDTAQHGRSLCAMDQWCVAKQGRSLCASSETGWRLACPVGMVIYVCTKRRWCWARAIGALLCGAQPLAHAPTGWPHWYSRTGHTACRFCVAACRARVLSSVASHAKHSPQRHARAKSVQYTTLRTT